ncbi:Zinc finger BED domain-containing protein DAYSLEEPER [Linum perenne]
MSFKEILVGTVKMAECIYCKAKFRMASSGATSHLKRHADKCPRKPANLADKNQQQLSLAANNYHTNVNLVREKLYALYNEYATEYNDRNIDSQTEEGGVATTTNSTTTSVQETTATGRAKFDSIVQSGENSSVLKNELDAYLDAALESIKDPEFNVIDWWKSERTKYKILSKMACEIMAIPITSVASEAAFSAGGRVIDPSRSSLGQKTIEALLCSQDWLRNHYGLTSGSKVSFLLTFISVIVQINM